MVMIVSPVAEPSGWSQRSIGLEKEAGIYGNNVNGFVLNIGRTYSQALNEGPVNTLSPISPCTKVGSNGEINGGLGITQVRAIYLHRRRRAH